MTAMATYPLYNDKNKDWAENLWQSPKDIWSQWFKPVKPYGALISTGFSLLDQTLPTQGWPKGIVEVKRVNGQKQVLSVFSSSIASLSEMGKQTLFIAPQEKPFDAMVGENKAKVENLLSIYPSNIKDTLWVLENALSDKKTGLVFFWLKPEDESRFGSTLRRLRQAAMQGGSTLVVMRDASTSDDLPLTQLNLAIRPLAGRSVNIDILKAHGQSTHGRHVIMRFH